MNDRADAKDEERLGEEENNKFGNEASCLVGCLMTFVWCFEQRRLLFCAQAILKRPARWYEKVGEKAPQKAKKKAEGEDDAAEKQKLAKQEKDQDYSAEKQKRPKQDKDENDAVEKPKRAKQEKAFAVDDLLGVVEGGLHRGGLGCAVHGVGGVGFWVVVDSGWSV